MCQKALFLLLSLYPMTVLAQQEVGASSPEELVKRYVQAMRSGDQKALEALIPEMGPLNQKLKNAVQLLDERMKLEKAWKLEIKSRFTLKDKDEDRFSSPRDIPQQSNSPEMVRALPHYSAKIIAKETVSPDHIKLTVEGTHNDQADKQVTHWQAIKHEGKWVLSNPDMKRTVQLHETAMLKSAGTRESRRAMQQAIDDLTVRQQSNILSSPVRSVPWQSCLSIT